MTSRPTPAERAAELGARLDALIAAGEQGAMCDLVAEAFARRADAGDLAEVAALVSAVPDELLAHHPQVLLELARACGAEARVRLRHRLLERARRLEGVTASGFELALEAELLMGHATDTQADEVEKGATELHARLDAAPSSRLADEARARSSHALGRALSWRGDPVSMSAAEDALVVAIGTARALGRDEWRAASLLTLGYGVYFERGEEERGRVRLREGMELLPVGHPRRAALGAFLAESQVRAHLGAEAQELLDQLWSEAADNGDQRALGYTAWIRALHTAEQGERAATLEWLASAERHPGDWFEHSTGSEFLNDAALCAERVGAVELADGYLARAQERSVADGYPETAWLATGVINARRGDPAVAVDALVRLLDEPWFPVRDAWTARLHLALARLRAGDEEGAAQDAARALEAAVALVGPGRAAATLEDLPALLGRLEPDLVRRLGPLAAAAGSKLATRLSASAPRVHLFGGLAVSVGGTAVPVPSGKTAQLLILLAVVAAPLPVDVVIDELWPDVSAEVGRRRLRNVLARLRAACGDLVVRRGETLRLDPTTELDVAAFEAAHRAVLQAPPPERPALAEAAVAQFRDDLLPEAAYAPRVIRLRDHLTRRAVELLGIVADGAEVEGRIADAVDALDHINELDPYNETVLERGRDLLRSHGREQQAEEWAERLRRLESTPW